MDISHDTRIVDKIRTTALTAIEEQEGVVGHFVWWRLLDVNHHKLIASAKVRTDDDTFDVWIIVDLDTEEAVAT